jgi:hypothetical protein
VAFLKSKSYLKKIIKISAIVLFGLFTLYVSYRAYTAAIIKKNEAYTVAVASINKNNLLLSKIGGISGFGQFPKGSISESDAVLVIPVKGKKRNATVITFLTKLSDNHWRLYQMVDDLE